MKFTMKFTLLQIPMHRIVLTLACFGMLVMSQFASAQSDELIFEEGTSEAQRDLGKVFSGALLGTAAGLLDAENSRSSGGLRLRYAQAFDSGVSVVLEGDSYASNVDLELEREITDTSNGEVTTETLAISSSTHTTELREGYFRYNNRFFDFATGRQLLSLGQFDVFSPIDFVLPFDLSSSRIEFSKVANKYPQTTHSLTLYPTPNLELQYHLFPNIERDPITEDLLEVDENYRLDAGNELVAEFMTPKDEAQSIGRIVYNGERFSVGFTHYEGFQLLPESMPKLASGLGMDASHQQLNQRIPNPSYPETSGQGLEFAFHKGNYAFKYEVLALEQYLEFPLCAPGRTQCREYYNYLRDNFDGNAWANTDSVFHGIGFDFNSEDWTVNFALYAITDQSNARVQRALDLWEEVSDDEVPLDNILFPVFHAAKHWGDGKTRTTGFGVGILGAVGGATLYHGWEATENLTFGLSLDAFSYRSDMQIEEREENEAESQFANENRYVSVEPESDFVPALRFSFKYTF